MKSPQRGFVGMLVVLVLAVWAAPSQAVYVWNGGGVIGGNTSTANGPVNAWGNADNWLVSGSPPPTAPSASDDVQVTFNETYLGGSAALEISAADIGQNVVIRGISSTVDRRVQVIGDASFTSLDYVKGGTTGLGIDPGITLALTGGTALVPTFKTDVRSTVTVSPSYTFDGTLEATAAQVFFHIDSTHGGRLLVSNPSATVDFNNRSLFLGSSGILEFVTAPTLTSAPPSVSFIGIGGKLLSQSGTLGNAFSNTHLRADEERTAVGTVSEGTFQSVRVGTTTSSSGSPSLFMEGDLTVAGDIGDGETAILVRRINRTGGVPNNNYGRLLLQGNDLTVLSDRAVVVGEVDGTVYAAGTSPHRAQRSELNLTSQGGNDTTATLAGNLAVGVNGILVGSSATQINLAGDFIHSSQNETGHETSKYIMNLSTMQLNGNGNFLEQQQFEVQGFDFGANVDNPSAHTLGMAQYGLGGLIVGESMLSPTWVLLTDDYDFGYDSLPDALYLDSLNVNEGSVLVLNGQKVYVQGVLVNAFDTQYGNGLIVNTALVGSPAVPEPATAMLLGCGLLGLCLRRKPSRAKSRSAV